MSSLAGTWHDFRESRLIELAAEHGGRVDALLGVDGLVEELFTQFTATDDYFAAMRRSRSSPSAATPRTRKISGHISRRWDSSEHPPSPSPSHDVTELASHLAALPLDGLRERDVVPHHSSLGGEPFRRYAATTSSRTAHLPPKLRTMTGGRSPSDSGPLSCTSSPTDSPSFASGWAVIEGSDPLASRLRGRRGDRWVAIRSTRAGGECTRLTRLSQFLEELCKGH